MNEVKTWQQRCEEHPDHQDRIVTEQMVRNRMQEEIDDLRASIFDLQKEQDENAQRALEIAKQRRELSDAEIQAAIDSVNTYTGDYANAIARAVLTAAGGAE